MISNVKHFDRNRILRYYHLRHLIETFYHEAKQHLGLERRQLRKLKGVHRHWTLVFTAYSILKQGVVGSSLCKLLKTKLQTIGDGCRIHNTTNTGKTCDADLQTSTTTTNTNTNTAGDNYGTLDKPSKLSIYSIVE